MHGFFYIALFSNEDGKCIIDFKNLTFTKTIFDLDYNKILSEQGISFQDLNYNDEPLNLKIQLEELEFPLIYSFVKGQKFYIIVVTDSFQTRLIPFLEKSIIEFDQKFDTQVDGGIMKEEITTFAKENFSRNFSRYLFPDFLIPEKSNTMNKDDFSKLLEKKEIDKKIYDNIDGIWSIEEFSEEMDIDLDQIHEKFFYMWVNNLIYFRFQYYNWDIFEHTGFAPLYLEDGSPQNLSLINKYNSSKIIKVLQLIESGISFKKLLEQSDLTKIKLQSYMTELVKRNIVQKKRILPTIKHISEDLLPLLTMQGFKKEDFNLLEKLEEYFLGEKDLNEVALKISIDPKKIKAVIDKCATAISIID